ncbi:MAG: N-acetylmuramoyl-L-alanine amidase [Steroidobacteraceae bacterium]
MRLALLGLCAASAQAASSSQQLQKLALNAGSAGASLELRLSAAVSERVFQLSNPDRLVIDLPATRRAHNLTVPAAAGVVEAVRVGPQSNGTLRVVLQLRAASKYQLSRQNVAGGYALRVQLAGGGRADKRLARAADGAGTAAVAAAAPAAPLTAASQAATAAAEPARLAAVKSAPQGGGNDIIIAIDAGHGGADPGATGMRGTHEKDVTLAIARALAARINAETGMRAVLTRDGDYFIPLRDRMVRARNARADLFLSIHADAVRNRDVSGASVYVVSNRGASSEAARWLAERENSADLKGGVSLADVSGNLASVLMDLSQSASQGASVEVADEVLKSLDGVGVVRKPEVQYAAFVVLKSPDIPSLLVETAYISNPGEELRLKSAGSQQQLAQAIFSGLQRYFTDHPPAGSLYARLHRDDSAGGGGVKLARSAD